MIEKRVRKILQIEYEKKLLIYDDENFASYFDYALMLRANDFIVYLYDDIERIRYVYETQIKNSETPCAIIVTRAIYVPSDIRNSFYQVELSLKNVYPNMDAEILKEHKQDLNLIDLSYDKFERDCIKDSQTAYYISNVSFSKKNILEFIHREEKRIQERMVMDTSSLKWIDISKMNAKLGRYACFHNITRDQSIIDEAFNAFVLDGYQKLHTTISQDAPIILPKVMDQIADGKKVALVVMDGMSMFDFEILSDYLQDFDYSFGGSFAMIPTITSISRQSLLTGKYPQYLENPFSLTKEKAGFFEACQEHGYLEQECFYGRGYDVELPSTKKIVAIIINDIDDIVHGQQQGRMGMFNDVKLWAQRGKLQNLLKMLLKRV